MIWHMSRLSGHLVDRLLNMIFRIRSPKGISGQNMSDLPNGSLTALFLSQQSANLK